MVSDARSLSLEKSEKGKGISNKLGLVSRIERDNVCSAHHRVYQVKTCAPVTNCVQKSTGRSLQLILEVPTNKDYVRYTFRGYRIVGCSGRAHNHPVADGSTPSKAGRQNPYALVHKPHIPDQPNSGGHAQASTSSVAYDTIPCYDNSRIQVR